MCATCHDAPPAYVHVSQWSASRMARSDALAEQRDDARCARCHTTGGFLNAIGVRVRPDRSRDPDGATVGIACAACHSPHGEHTGSSSLVRRVAWPLSLPSTPSAPALATEPSALCVQCHAPVDDERAPSASAASLWLGRARLSDAVGGGELSGGAPHAQIPGGCMGCHGATAATAPTTDTAPRRTEHSFRVDPALCAKCHEQDPSHAPSGAAAVTLSERAARLAGELARRCAAPSIGAVPAHAHAGQATCPTPPLARALYLARLVAEDPAAFVHNAIFARRLLDEAEGALATVR